MNILLQTSKDITCHVWFSHSLTHLLAQILTNLLTHPLTHSVNSFTYSFTSSFASLLTHTLNQYYSFIFSLTLITKLTKWPNLLPTQCSLNHPSHSFIHLLTHSFISVFIYSFTEPPHSFESFIHPLTQSLTYSLTLLNSSFAHSLNDLNKMT